MSISYTSSPAPIPGLISQHSINLIIGSPTSGRTTLALTEFERYLGGGEFFGAILPSGHPIAQCAVLTCGSLTAMHQRLPDMQLAHCSDPVRFPIRDWKPTAAESLPESLRRHHDELSLAARRPVRFIFVENFQMMMESGKMTEVKPVHKFYADIHDFLIATDCAILGTVGQGKMKNGESYPLLADRIYGSIGWAQDVGAMIGIQPISLNVSQERRGSIRQVTIAPPKARTTSYYADFDDLGRIERISFTDAAQETAESKMDIALRDFKPGVEFTRSELIEIGTRMQVGESAVDRWIQSRADDRVGMLEKTGKSLQSRKYRKPMEN